MKTKKLFLAIILFAGMSIQANATTFNVFDTLDAGVGSLRQAIIDANAAPGADIIEFSSFMSGTITLASALPPIQGGLTISGPFAGNISVSGNHLFKIFEIAGNATISRLRIIDGDNYGILFQTNPVFAFTLNVSDCTFSGPEQTAIVTGNGSANIDGCTFTGNFNAISMVYTSGTITNSTFSGNTSGTIYHVGTTFFPLTPLYITNCTISGNSNSTEGGGIRATNGSVFLSNTIVAGNTGSTGPDLYGGFNSQGYNFIGKGDGSFGITNGVNNDQVGTIASPIDPMLGALANNGGLTQTMALPCGSPAVNAADPATNTSDQRGFAIAGGRRDIGAFERQTETLVVTSTADSGPGTLRNALAIACSGDVITFSVTGVITLISGLNISKTITIQGPGANILSVSGNNAVRVFDINNVDVIISGLSIINGGGVTDGGGIHFSASFKLLSVFNCTFSGNSAGYGGAIFTEQGSFFNITGCMFAFNVATFGYGGSMFINQNSGTITNSTFSGNSAGGRGGAISYLASFNGPSSFSITNCTISGNSSSNGGGIHTLGGPAALSNTIVTGNSSSNGPDVNGSFTSQGYNFIGKSDGSTGFTNGVNNDQVGTIAAPIDPMLSALADNGGPTKTMALQCSSPAINAANPATTGSDQRGVAMMGGRRDIGAYESDLIPPTINGSTSFCAGSSTTLNAGTYSGYNWSTGATTQTISVNTAGTFTVTVTNASGCTSSTSAATSINQSPAPSISGTLSFCAGSSTTLNAGTYSGYNWSTGATTQTINVNTATTVTVTVTDGNGCSGSTSAATSVNQNPAPSISGTLSFCAGSSTTLNAGTYSGYNWSTGATTQTIAVSSAGTFTVTVTNASGCSGSTSAATSVNQNPAPSISGTNFLCAGGSTTLDAGSFAGYLWSTAATTQTISVNTSATYTVTVTNASGCTASTSRTLTHPPALTVDAGPNKIVYRGYPDSSCTKLQSSGVGGGVAPRTLLWSTGSTASFINVCPTTSTVYYLTVTDANGCTKKDSVKVCVIDVRCGSGNTKVTICHGTGSVSNPFQTLCISPADAKWHILHHPGEKLGACGISRTCSFPGARLADEEMQDTGEQENDLTAYPNPTSGEMNISFHSEEGGMYLLRVVSVTGQVLLSEMKQAAEGENKYTINLKDYAPGIYMVLLHSGDDMRQIRIVKE